MTVYKNTNPSSSLSAVEFSKGTGGNYAFFHVWDEAHKEELKSWLAKPELGQEIIAETRINGKPIIVTRSDKSQEDITKALADRGDKIEPEKIEKKFNPWAWRGYLSVVGQSLMLAASATAYKKDKVTGEVKIGAKGADAVAVGGFAVLNLAANFINIIFGAQRSTDEHRLRALKLTMNEKFSDVVPEGVTLPDVEEQRAKLRKEDDKQDLQSTSKELLKRHSVRFGEIFLRLLGSVSLSFPITQWGKAAKELSKGSLSKAIEVGRNPTKATFYTGIGMVAGKLISFAAKEPDPYNPDPPTWLDKFREKVVFRLSTAVEGGATAYMTYDRFKNQKIKIGEKISPDYLGGVGNIVFLAGYGARWFAPYGVKEVDMKELNAHITDGLARIPKEELPQRLADGTAYLKNHFKDKPIEFGQVFTQLADELEQYHHISLGNKPPSQIELATAEEPAKAETKFTAKVEPKKRTEITDKQTVSFSEKLAMAQEATPSPVR